MTNIMIIVLFMVFYTSRCKITQKFRNPPTISSIIHKFFIFTHLSQVDTDLTQMRKGAEFQCLMKLSDTVFVSPQRDRPATWRPENAEKATRL